MVITVLIFLSNRISNNADSDTTGYVRQIGLLSGFNWQRGLTYIGMGIIFVGLISVLFLKDFQWPTTIICLFCGLLFGAFLLNKAFILL